MKLGKRFLTLAFAVGIGLCAYPYANASESGHAHWGYEGEHGPDHWGMMSKDYAACSEGKQQSPINITATESADLADIVFNYKTSELHVLNNGHTVQVNYDSGSSITIDGVQYNLIQFHFHTPSEHTINGKSFGNELHLVHKNDKGELAVVGVLIEEGKENPAFKAIWSNLPKKANEKKDVKVAIDAAQLLPETKSFYRYMGSLTTPPCSESVNWNVLKTPIQMSKKQIEAIQKIMHKNNRPVQPMHDRKVTADSITH